MKPREMWIDQDEHDLIRDEVIESLGEVDSDDTRAARAYGHVTGGIIVLASTLTAESLDELIMHIRSAARDYSLAIDETAP